MSDKRQVPSPLQKLIDFDVKLSQRFRDFLHGFLAFRSMEIHYNILEKSCHGLVWLAGWLAFIWLVNSPKLYQMQVNFYCGLILDIIFVAVIKAYVRRPRPDNQFKLGFTTLVPDLFSFPSGHASRGTFIMLFFMVLYPLPIYCFPPLAAWVTSLSISRVLMKRHYLLDVLGGIVLGIVNTFIISILWLSPETCSDMLSFLTNEKFEGAEYHV